MHESRKACEVEAEILEALDDIALSRVCTSDGSGKDLVRFLNRRADKVTTKNSSTLVVNEHKMMNRLKKLPILLSTDSARLY